jgi:hypothetical protein
MCMEDTGKSLQPADPRAQPPITAQLCQIRLHQPQIRLHCAKLGYNRLKLGYKLVKYAVMYPNCYHSRPLRVHARTTHTPRGQQSSGQHFYVHSISIHLVSYMCPDIPTHSHTHANAPWLTCAMESVVCNDAHATVTSPRSQHRRDPTTVDGGSLGTSAKLACPLSLSASLSSLDPCWCKHTCRRLDVPLPDQSLRHRRMRLQPTASSLLSILQWISQGYL